ncbi:MAG: porin family protein [Thermoanaerobaculia bacterium]
MFSKTLCALGLVALGASTPALAQSTWAGAFVGINAPSTSIETSLRTDGSPSGSSSLVGGIYLDQQISDLFSFRVGVFYVSRETSIRFQDPINNLPPIDADYKLGFLEFPFQLKATFRRDQKIEPYLFIGPSVGVRLSAKSDNTSGTARQEFDVGDQFGSFSVAVAAGAGVRFLVSPRVALSGEASYSVGLTNLAKATGNSWKQRDFRAMVGLEFGF